MNPRNQSFVVTLLLIVAVVAMVVMALQNESTTQEALTINQVADEPEGAGPGAAGIAGDGGRG